MLYCGDARELLPAVVGDGEADFVFTDPPYGHNNNNGDLIHRWEAALGRLPGGSDSPLESRPIANDGAEANELVQWFFHESSRILSPGCCCCCGGGPDPQFARWSLWIDEAIGFKQMVIWDKGPMGMGWHYRRSYETVLVAEKPGAACRWFDETDRIENVIRPYTLGIRKIIPSHKQHPTAKPPELAMHFIGLHTEQQQLVVDPFAGGGSTLVACARLGRRGLGIELSEEFCEMTAKAVDYELNQGRLFAPKPIRETLSELFPK